MVDVHKRATVVDDEGRRKSRPAKPPGLWKRLAPLPIPPLIGLAYVLVLPFLGIATFLGLGAGRLSTSIPFRPAA